MRITNNSCGITQYHQNKYSFISQAIARICFSLSVRRHLGICRIAILSVAFGYEARHAAASLKMSKPSDMWAVSFSFVWLRETSDILIFWQEKNMTFELLPPPVFLFFLWWGYNTHQEYKRFLSEYELFSDFQVMTEVMRRRGTEPRRGL